MTKDKL